MEATTLPLEPLQQTHDNMLVIYFKDDGEIYSVAYGYSTLEEFYGEKRAPQFAQIFGGLLITPASDYLFNMFHDFRVDLSVPDQPQLALRHESMRMYDIFERTKVL